MAKNRWRQKNGVAKAVRTPRYKMRVNKSKKDYSRKARRDEELPEAQGNRKKGTTMQNDDGTEDVLLHPEEDLVEEETNAISFATRKKIKIDKAMPSEETQFLQLGLDAFLEEMKLNPKGFLAIIFDQDESPRIIWAGDVDTIHSIGALEVAKNEFLKTISPTDQE